MKHKLHARGMLMKMGWGGLSCILVMQYTEKVTNLFKS